MKTASKRPKRHFAVTYNWALTCIGDTELRARVKAILLAASKMAAATAEAIEKRFAKLGKELRRLAVSSPEVFDALIVVVEGGVRKPRCSAVYSLVAEVVGDLLTRGHLNRTQMARVLRGLVTSWCEITELGFDCAFGDETGYITDRILDNMDAPVYHVRDRMPELIVSACLCRLFESPGSPVLGFCEGFLPDAEMDFLESVNKEDFEDADDVWTWDWHTSRRI